MFFSVPQPGTDAEGTLLNSALWGVLVEMANAYQNNRLAPPAEASSIAGKVIYENDSGSAILAGQLAHGQSLTALATSDDEVGWFTNTEPYFEMIDPVWHTGIDNIVPVQRDVPDGQTYDHPPSYFGTVLVTQVKTTDRYVMIDPANPIEMKTADAGIYRLLGYDGQGRAVVDFRDSQPFWRYKLTQASQQPAVTTAKLVRVDGDEYSSTAINLSDPLGLMDDQTTDAEGWCIHIGNEFHAIQAPC